MSWIKTPLSILLLSLAALAEQPAVAPVIPKKAAPPRAPITATKPQGLTVNGIIDMVQAGLSEDVIVSSLRKEDKPFDLSSDELIRLKKANVTDGVLKVMLNPKAEIKPVAFAAPPPPVAPPVIIQTPLFTGIPAVTPSGATPALGSNANGDLNNPMTPHDSGIYLYAKNRDENPEMIVLERAASQGTKTGGVWGSVVTQGIKKVHYKSVIPGAHASIRIDGASVIFYFYFDDKAAGLGKGLFGSISNPNQFALVKLDSTKSNRETTTMEVGAFGTSTGTNSKAMIGFKSERIRTGLYKVVPSEPMEPGEYCFLASTDMFDFGVNANQ
jgi:hypothetical protein